MITDLTDRSCEVAGPARRIYTHNLLDNAGFASADRILPEYQHLQVGDWMPMVKKITATTAFKATALETGQWLPWQKPDGTRAWKLIRLDDGRMEQSSTVWRC